MTISDSSRVRPTARRSALAGIAFATAVLVIALAIWWQSPSEKGIPTDALPSASQEIPLESADARAVRGAQASPSASASPKMIEVRARLIDKVSRRGLEGLPLALASNDGMDVMLGRSDGQGIVVMNREAWPSPSPMVIRVPEQLGGGTVRQSIALDPSKTNILEIPVYSRLHVRFLGERPSAGSTLEGRVTILPFPELPSPEALGDEEKRRELEHSRTSPERYIKNLRSFGLLQRDWREERPIAPEGDCIIDLPDEGIVVAMAMVSAMGTGVATAQIRRGESTELDLTLHQDRKLRGFVGDLDRKGIGGARVKIVEITKVRKGEFFQRVQPPDPTRGELLGRRPNGDMVSIREFFAITGDDGIYVAEIGHGNLELTTSCFSDAWMPGYATREVSVGGSSEVTMDMLVAPRIPKRMLVRIGGEPARSLELWFTEGPQRPRRAGFGLKFPKVACDDAGYVDVSMLESRSTYEAVFYTSERHATRFECRDEGTIDFP